MSSNVHMADDRSFVIVLLADAIVLIIVPFLFQRLELAPCDRMAWPLWIGAILCTIARKYKVFLIYYKCKVLAYSQWDLLWDCGSDGRRRMPRTHPTSTSGHTEHSERFKNRGVCQYRNYEPFEDNKCGSSSCCLGTRVTDFTLADRERQI